MDTSTLTNELLAFFKALADANRLKIVGLLAREPLSVEQLASLLELAPSTVSHHLARLAEVGLVTARAESYYNIYRFESDALEAMARRLLARETLPAIAADVKRDGYDEKVLTIFLLPDGRLKSIPTQRKKRLVVLQHIVKSFEPGVRYPEKQVNEILGRFSAATAALRRELIADHLMARERGVYWRVEA
ncbi:MAG TPA: metalloregulator ArsR/SmtB family transcription factor [Ardenticatenaceae bacterium]|nr:metalloregulator ArsR/SmtB family transcription factor [Ardenticatenaceae bacterium]